VEVLCDTTGRELLSPAVIHDGHRFVMWTVEIADAQFTIVRRSSLDGVAWSAPEECKLTGLEAPRHPWHLDVIQESDRWSALLVSCIGSGGGKSKMHYAFSEDQGLSWTTLGFLLDQCYEFEADVQYRGSLLPSPGCAGEYDLWYSAACSRHFFSIAHTRLSRSHNQWLPSGAGSARVATSPLPPIPGIHESATCRFSSSDVRASTIAITNLDQ